MASNRKIAIKICGMRDEQNIQQVASFAPDYMGFIFYGPSPRFVGDTFQLPAIASSINKVGVFVNASTEAILEITDRYQLNYVQLHGSESVDQVAKLKDKGLQVIKVFSVDDNFDFQVTKPFVPVADYFLFDTKGKNFGGNGVTFNWNMLKHYDQEVPFFLSGGLTPAHLDSLSELQYMNIHGLDINSGVESAPGLKDINKVKEIFNHPTLI